MHTAKGIAPVVAVLLLALGLGGGYVYYNDPGNIIERVEWLISPETPEEVLAGMFDALPDVRTLAFSGSGGGPLTVPDPSAIMGLSGSKTAAAPKGEGTLSVSGVADLATSTFALSIDVTRTGEKPVAFAFELRKPSANMVYALISKAPQELSFLSGSWVSFNITKTMSANSKENIDKTLQAAANKEEKVRYMTKLKEHRVFTAVEVTDLFPDPRLPLVYGDAVRHLSITIDKPALKAFLDDVRGHAMTSSEEADFEDGFRKNALASARTEIWIGTYDHLPRMIEMSNTKPGQSIAKFTVTFTDFNKPVVVSTPAESKSFEEMIGAFFLSKAFQGGNINVKKSVGTQ